MALSTTDIGSVPLTHSRPNLERAVRAKIAAGIDTICLPQTPDVDMNEIFLSSLAKTGALAKGADGKYSCSEDSLAGGRAEPPYEDWLLSFASGEARANGRRLKVAVTAPNVLAERIYTPSGDPLNLDEDLFGAFAFGPYLSIVEGLAGDCRVDELQFDSPALGAIVPESSSGALWLQTLSDMIGIARDAGKPVAVHCCGGVDLGTAQALAHLKPDYFLLEVAGPKSQENVRWIKYAYQNGLWDDVRLGLGCVSTDQFSQEEIDSIRKGVLPAAEPLDSVKSLFYGIGPEKIAYLNPNCGYGSKLKEFKSVLKGTARSPEEEAFSFVEAKYKRLAEARDAILAAKP